MAMLCVIGWLFPGFAPLWLWLPDGVWQQTPDQYDTVKTNQPWIGLKKTVRRIRSPCLRGIWTSFGVRLEGG